MPLHDNDRVSDVRPSAIVIGSSGGFGRVICEALCHEGWIVFGMDRQKPPISLRSVNAFNPIRIDLLKQGEITNAIDGLTLSNGIQAVIHAAGVYDHFALAEAEKSRLDALLGVNLISFAEVVSSSFNHVLAGKGRYIAISSETATVSLPFQAYGMSKRMLEVYLDALRQELDLLGIPVVAIRPGAHETKLLKTSKEKLADFPDDSPFASFLKKVRDEGQRIIDKGSAAPDDIVPIIMQALSLAHPKPVYHLNVAPHFRVLRWLPDTLVRAIFRNVLKK